MNKLALIIISLILAGEESMKWWQGLLIGSTVTGVAILGTCYACTKVIEEVFELTELRIVNHQMTIDKWGDAIVTGKAKNTSDSELTMVNVEVRCYDAEGVLLGESSDYIGDLKAGELCKFEVYGYGVDADEIADYKVEGHGW